MSAQALKNLSAINPVQVMLAIALDWGLIIAALVAALMAQHWVVSLMSIVLIGARQHGLLIVMHEAAHLGLARNRRVNDLVSDLLLAWPLFVSTRRYRVNHMAHHKHLNSVDDPDWVRYRSAEAADPSEWRFPMKRSRLIGLLLRDLLGLNTAQQVKKILLFSGASQRAGASDAPRRPDLGRVLYYLAVAAMLTWVEGWTAFALYWLVPALTVLKVALRWRLMAEHILPDGSDGTRTTVAGGLGRLLVAPHNIGLHAEHHRHPGIRFHHLPAAHARFKALGVYEGESHLTRGYLAVLKELTFGGRVRRVYADPKALSAGQVERIWRFFSQHVQRERSEFEARLKGCDELVCFENEQGELQGILAMHILTRPALVLHLQWATLSPALRGKQVLMGVLLRRYLALRLRHPLRRMYLLAATATHLSYLAMARAVTDFWPQPERPTPDREQRIIDGAMRRIAGETWDAEAGLMRGLGRWRYQARRPSLAEAQDPLLRAYLRWNPDGEAGDAVPCLIPATLKNALVAVYLRVKRSHTPKASVRLQQQPD